VKLQLIRRGIAKGRTPFIGASSATFIYVRREVVLTYFTNEDENERVWTDF
jgi:hypothetical protein